MKFLAKLIKKSGNQCISKLVRNCGEKNEVFAEWHQQLAHRDHRGTGRNKIVEYDYVALGYGRLVLAAQAFCER